MQAEALAERHKATSRVTWLGAVCNLFLSLVKCLAGWFGHSHALLADGIHSLSDLIADGVVLIASKFSSEEADHEHPYGHQRIETAATIGIAGFLVFAGLGIIISGVQHILSPIHDKISPYVLWTAILALVVNEAIYWITIRIAKKIQSDMLVAHAWHRRSDAAASLIVLIGIIGSMLGIYYFDGLAAIVIGLFILRMAWRMGRASFDELTDRGVDEEELEKIKNAIQSVEGVCALHQLRTRLMAGKIIADVHIIVDPLLSVSEGHYIGDKVYERLAKGFPSLEDVTVHVDSEDDEVQHFTRYLPSREQILSALKNLSLPYFQEMKLKAIHYQANHVILECVFSLAVLTKTNAETLEKSYAEKIQTLYPAAKVKIFFQ
jgi:cation diffusion facilitator family transporter